MSRFTHIRGWSVARRGLADESGIALPVAVIMIGIVLSLGAVAVQQALSATDGTTRDTQVKRAVQAAEAGIEIGLSRLNAHSATINDPASTGLRCPSVDPVSGDVVLEPVDEFLAWCPPTDTEELGNEESYRYTISNLRYDGSRLEGHKDFGPPFFDDDGDGDADRGLNGTIDRVIVSTGCASASGAPCDPYAPEPGDVVRRVAVQTSALDVSQLFTDYAAFSDQDLVLGNQSDVGSPEVPGNARSNANIFLHHPNAEIFGDATPGPTDLEGNTHTVSGAGQVHGSSAPAPSPIELPPVEMPPPETVDGEICEAITIDGEWVVECPADGGYDPTTRVLNVNDDVTVFQGNTFVLCAITVTNSATIWFQPLDLGRPVRVYIDSPENCGGTTTSMSISNNPTLDWARPLLGLEANEFPPFGMVEFYFGGGDPPTSISLSNNNNAIMPFEIYAPHSNVLVENRARLVGGIIANQLTMTNNTVINPADPNLPGFGSAIPTFYERDLFSECTSEPPPADEPDAGCWK